MAFRTGSDQQRAYDAAKTTARTLRQYCVSFNTDAAAESVSGNQVLELRTRLLAADAIFFEAKEVENIASYVQSIEDDPTYDVIDAFQVMRTAIGDAVTQIEGDYPKDANEWLLTEKFTTTGTNVRQFSPTATATLRTKVQAVIASIEEPLTLLSA